MADTARQWDLGVAIGVARVAIGTTMVATRSFGATTLGADREDKVVPAALAAFGTRDALLGAAALFSTRPGGDVSKTLVAGAANDVLDAAVVGGLVAAGRLPKGRGIAVVVFSLFIGLADFALARHAKRPAGLTLTG